MFSLKKSKKIEHTLFTKKLYLSNTKNTSNLTPKASIILGLTMTSIGLGTYFFNKNDASNSAEPHVIKEPSLSYLAMGITATTGVPGEIKELFENCTEEELDEMIKVNTCRGNNILHLTAQFNPYEDGLTILLNILGEKARPLALQANHSSQQAIQKIKQNKKLEDKTRHNQINKLLPLTKNLSIKPLSEPIDADKLISNRYSHIKDKQLKHDLVMAVQEMNEIRKIIQGSSTHFAINNSLEDPKFEDITLSIQSLRVQINTTTLSYNYMPFLYSYNEPLEIVADYALHHQVANCDELSAIMYINLKKKKIYSSCGIVTITNGDHVINLLNHIPDSPPNDHTKWGENAIIADAWSGDVYLASELPSHLSEFKCITYKDKPHCYLVPFNPRFHQLSVKQSFQAEHTIQPTNKH